MAKNICRAFANENRLKLVACLNRPRTVTELLHDCHLSQSALSQHLKVLKDCGVVFIKKDGKYIFYQAVDREIIKIAKLLLAYK